MQGIALALIRSGSPPLAPKPILYYSFGDRSAKRPRTAGESTMRHLRFTRNSLWGACGSRPKAQFLRLINMQEWWQRGRHDNCNPFLSFILGLQ
jgi:hypothetical protein